MNINKFIGFCGMFAFLFFISSCEIDPDLNIDPNNPVDVSISQLLPTAQIGTFIAYSSNNARMSSMWMQQHSGLARQYFTIEGYNMVESDVNLDWARAYADGLADFQRLIEKSESLEGTRHYAGIAKINTAMILGVLTDLFGDIPYSTAFKGADGETKATFDSQQDIYASIQTLLDEALEDLQAESPITPESDDLIYGGNIGKWTAAANVLKARYHIHLSKVNGASAYTDALAALDAGGFSNTGDNANATFYSSGGNENLWFRFYSNRGTDMGAGEFGVNLLADNNDPRLSTYYKPDASGAIRGCPPGGGDVSVSTTGDAFAGIAATAPLITFEEQKFIEAEAAFQTGDTERAATAYNEAVTAAIDLHGGADSIFLANNAMETGATISAEKISEQKYIALFTQIEVYNDWRRTGYPDLNSRLAANADASEIPRRFPYPLDERLYNGENLPTAGTRVWWDQ